jgi:hypothetical protein
VQGLGIFRGEGHFFFLGVCEWRVDAGCTGVFLGGVYHGITDLEKHTKFMESLNLIICVPKSSLYNATSCAEDRP